METLGRGSIGGFITFAAISAAGELLRAETQRGGTRALSTTGETCGVEPPEAIARAPFAALISSGPDRPNPLAQFVPGDGALGLVTGHRLPNATGADGRPLNVASLDHLRAGMSAAEPVEAAFAGNEQENAGLLAVDVAGRVKARSSARLQRRPDLGGARRQSRDGRLVVETLLNSVRPYPALAEVACDIALETMQGEPQPTGWLTLNAGTPVGLGEEGTVEVDGNLVATRIITSDPLVMKGSHLCAPVSLGSAVGQDGRKLGATL